MDEVKPDGAMYNDRGGGAAFYRSTVLRAIDELTKEYARGQTEALLADGDEAELGFYEGALQVARRLRTRFEGGTDG